MVQWSSQNDWIILFFFVSNSFIALRICLLPFNVTLGYCLLYAEILRVSGMMSNQGYSDFDRLRYRSPSPMASSNMSVGGTGLGGWNSITQEVCILQCLASDCHQDAFIPVVLSHLPTLKWWRLSLCTRFFCKWISWKLEIYAIVITYLFKNFGFEFSVWVGNSVCVFWCLLARCMCYMWPKKAKKDL